MTARSRDLARLQARLHAIPVAVRKEVFAALNRSADEMVATMKHLVPKNTGTLRDTIRKVPREPELSISIEAGGPATTKAVRDGVDATYDYALGVEFGTRDTSAQPFFFSSYRLNRKRVRPRARRAVAKAIKATGKGT